MAEPSPISQALAAAARAHIAVAARLLRAHGLYPGQELLLMMLWEADHQSQSELARALGNDLSTVSRTAQSLERSGLVTRRPSQEDRRSVTVSLTPAGRSLQPAVEQAWTALETATTAGLSDRQRGELLRLLRRIEHSLLDADAPPTGP